MNETHMDVIEICQHEHLCSSNVEYNSRQLLSEITGLLLLDTCVKRLRLSLLFRFSNLIEEEL